MESNYRVVLQKVLVYEGGFANHPQDPGGRTLQGVTQAVYDKYRKDHGLARKLLTKDMMGTADWGREMAEIYRKGYWVPPTCPVLSSGVDAAMMDYAVHSGPGRAVRVLQALIGRPVTGRMTSEDVTAANKRNPRELVLAICNERVRFLQSLKTWPTFGVGWGRRITSLRAFCDSLATGQRGPVTIEARESVGKGEVPTTKKAKKVVSTGTVAAGGGAGFSVGDWIAAHPGITAVICVVVFAGVAFVFYKLDEWRDKKQLTPMPVEIVPEIRGTA